MRDYGARDPVSNPIYAYICSIIYDQTPSLLLSRRGWRVRPRVDYYIAWQYHGTLLASSPALLGGQEREPGNYCMCKCQNRRILSAHDPWTICSCDRILCPAPHSM